MYGRDAIIALSKKAWFYLRIQGHRPETMAYAKIRVLDVSLEPPVDGNLLNERSLTWQRALKNASRVWKEID